MIVAALPPGWHENGAYRPTACFERLRRHVRNAAWALRLAAWLFTVIIDPEQQPEPPKTLIRRLFGLTNAESDVALRVMRGDGLKPISADIALSRATVNTHLQHVFDKTDTHRQAELVRLLLATIP